MASDTDLAWAAGFFDGEGCVHMRTGHNKNRRSFKLTICITNTSLPALEKFQAIAGYGRIHPMRIPVGKEHWRLRWQWVASTKQAEHIIIMLLPYLFLKKPQAELALKSRGYLSPRRGYKLYSPYYDQLAEIAMQISGLNGGKRKKEQEVLN